MSPDSGPFAAFSGFAPQAGRGRPAFRRELAGDAADAPDAVTPRILHPAFGTEETCELPKMSWNVLRFAENA